MAIDRKEAVRKYKETPRTMGVLVIRSRRPKSRPAIRQTISLSSKRCGATNSPPPAPYTTDRLPTPDSRLTATKAAISEAIAAPRRAVMSDES